MTDSKGYSEFVALVGQGKAILTVCRGASHFNFHFLKCFSYIPTRKWLQKIIFIGRLAHTFAAVLRWTTLSCGSWKSSRCFPVGLVNFVYPRKEVCFDSRATVSLGVWDWPLTVWRPVAPMFSQWCNADASIASMTKYCKQIVTRTHVCSMS